MGFKGWKEWLRPAKHLQPCKCEVSCLLPNLRLFGRREATFYNAFEYSLHHEVFTRFCSYKFNTSLVLSEPITTITARVLGVQEGSILPNPPSEVIAEMEMRKLTAVEVMLDYQKDPEPNPKHKPGGNGP
ncbi:hypothetical protein NC651_000951 [Populus alba x Populus x berolinensis]|nr:hypothetical protein NC651_000951 [Populus alba x Populus x berolinensis]